jgi:subtilisin family serine protease
MRSIALYAIWAAILLTAVPALAGRDGGEGASPPPSSGAAASGETQRYIVVLKDAVVDPGAVAARHASAYGAQVSHVYSSALKGYAAAIPADRVAALRADDRVEFLTLDREMSVLDTPGTGIRRINAYAKSNTGTGVHVAVIDTGIDVNHPDLAENIVGGRNCSSGGKSYDDGNGHGTHVAGIVAALDNGMGVVGVAPQAKLWAVRVLDRNGFGSWSSVICGIDFVDAKSPAKGGPISVANMSLGGLGSDDGACGTKNADALHQAICRAVTDGVTFVVAAGNSGTDLATFVPAAYDEVITVSALGDSDGGPCAAGAETIFGPDDTFAGFSNYATTSADAGHLVAAPGVAIYSTFKGGGYETKSGTSMASPHVAGAAALYLAAHLGATPATVRDALEALGEPENTNFNSECSSTTGKRGGPRSSHTDPSGRHPEAVVRADTL